MSKFDHSDLDGHLLRGLASAKPPLACPRMPMYMVWHLRYARDPAHLWLRSQLEAVSREALIMQQPLTEECP